MEGFLSLSIVFCAVCATSFVMRFLKQPLVVGYILSGIILGPQILNVLSGLAYIELSSHIGVAFLLFIVGTSLNPSLLREVGKAAVATGTGQVIITSFIGFLIVLLLGIDIRSALYIALALTFSSTIIIVKLLSDKGELRMLHGKITLGFLLVQDVIAMLFLIFISAFSQAEMFNLPLFFLLFAVKAVSLSILLVLATVYVLPTLTRLAAQSQELLFLFTLAWGLGIASFFSILGFTVEIGALIAGILLSLTPYAPEMAARMKPVRDFFIVLFFVLLGSGISLNSLNTILIPAIFLSLFVLIGNPIIVYVIMNLIGFKRRSGFLTAITVGQISEFSLILVTLGNRIGHVPGEMLSLVTLIGIITIAGSTYFIVYAHRMYAKIRDLLRFLEWKKHANRKLLPHEQSYENLLFGFDRVGADFVHVFKTFQKPFCVIDFNPASIERLERSNIPFLYGDAQDPDFLTEIDFSHTSLCVSTIPDFKTNLLLLNHIRSKNPKTITIILSHTVHEAKILYEHGTTYVLMPHHLGAQYASRMIAEKGTDLKRYETERNRHMKSLEA